MSEPLMTQHQYRAARLSDYMDFGHVVTITEDGKVEHGPDIFNAPESITDDEPLPEGWEYASTGYTGQDRYHGPWMHDSEQLAGRLAEDIIGTPGIYVAVYGEFTQDIAETIPADFPVQPLNDDDDATDRATCGNCGLSWDDAIATEYTPVPSARCPFEAFHEPELITEGWAVLRYTEEEA